MSKRHLRNDPICQNCGELVEKRFCSSCGQENIETRQSFGHLLRHFIEDLTHYDGNFWRTIRFLIFRPAYLTRAFLNGKRVCYVPPVRLYIFISFLTFLLPYLIPESRETASDKEFKKRVLKDTINQRPKNLSIDLLNRIVVVPKDYTSVSQLDSIQNTLPASERMSGFGRWLNKRYIKMQKFSKEELGERFFASFGHNMPKILIIYLPLFAFMLWLFHDKKRWLYFDHAIFTLHYFSFLLLIINIAYISDAFAFLNDDLFDVVATIFELIVFLGIVVYFFVAHKRMYQSKGGFITFMKAALIYLFNFGLFFGILIVAALITLLTIH